MALLNEMPQTSEKPQRERQRPPMPGGGESDVDMAVNQAMESGAMSDMGFDVQMASEEEHKVLGGILDSVETAIHGKTSDKILELLMGPKDPYEGISTAAHVLSLSSYMQANKQGIQVDPEIFLAENGVVQQTVEMLWEVATAADLVKNEDDEQMSAAYLDTIRKLGETILEEENPEAVKSAQELLIEMETGEPVEGEEVFAEEGMPESPQPGPRAPQAQPQAPNAMPPAMGGMMQQ